MKFKSAAQKHMMSAGISKKQIKRMADGRMESDPMRDYADMSTQESIRQRDARHRIEAMRIARELEI